MQKFATLVLRFAYSIGRRKEAAFPLHIIIIGVGISCHISGGLDKAIATVVRAQ